MSEEKIIEAVRKNPELYDTKHANYMKTKLKTRIWQDIATDLNLEGEAAKTMWLKLRNSYRDARRRQMKSLKSGAAPENIRPWRFQKQMTFLESFMSAGPREGNVNDSDDDSQHSSALPLSNEILDSENVEGEHCSSNHEQSNNADVEEDKVEESSTKTTGTLEQTSVANTKKQKIRKQDDVHCLLKRSLQKREERSKQREEERRKLESRDNPSDDPLYNFFLSMYQLTKNLPPQYQHRVRGQLFQAVSKAEEDVMNLQSRPSSSLTSYNYSVASSPSTHAWSDSHQTHFQISQQLQDRDQQDQTHIPLPQQPHGGDLQDQPDISALANYVQTFDSHNRL
ncbi:uncharacterized protein [Leptinotarsa decemlineata]|uniref:uncharacterized protein n=1 Tax=Leptinotarsa decemlineata TaxID=7539 RepID=UPI003D30D4F7